MNNPPAALCPAERRVSYGDPRTRRPREFSAFVTAAVERELRGQILDEYLADHERRNGPISEQEQDNARQAFDEVFAEDHQPILALVPEARSRGMEVEARATSELLLDAGLHGHRYAIDAVVAERALRQQRPVAMLTSDLDDMTKLCGGRVHLIAV